MGEHDGINMILARERQDEEARARRRKAAIRGMAQNAPLVALVAFNVFLLLADIRAFDAMSRVLGVQWLAATIVLGGFICFTLYEILYNYPHAETEQRVIAFAGMIVAAIFSIVMGGADYLLGREILGYTVVGVSAETLIWFAITVGAIEAAGFFAFYLFDPRRAANYHLERETARVDREAQLARMAGDALRVKLAQAGLEQQIIDQFGREAFEEMARRLTGRPARAINMASETPARVSSHLENLRETGAPPEGAHDESAPFGPTSRRNLSQR